MNDVFVERHWSEPVTEQRMQALAAMAPGCLDLHRVEWVASLLSSDGIDMFCHFRGPDAESVRIAVRQEGSARARVWPCAIQDAPGTTPADLARANVVVGHVFDEAPGVGERQPHAEIEMARLRVHRVRPLRSYLSADRRRMISLYLAPDADSVRLAQREAGLPPDQVWAVRRYSP